MATPSVTPNPNGNPFDQPLNSELQESQQHQAATVAASSNGNPFDEPLASEKAEAQTKSNPELDASKIRQMEVSGLTGMPTPNMSDADKASFQRGKAAGAVSVPVVAGLATGVGASVAPSEAGVGTLIDNAGEPIVKAAVNHLANLTKIVQAAKAMGWTTIGIKEA